MNNMEIVKQKLNIVKEKIDKLNYTINSISDLKNGNRKIYS